jgi:uncharacterized protein (UPF0264 family)
MAPKLLVSVKALNEVFEALEGGADIIDVKDPSSGSLGLPRIAIVKEVVKAIGHARECSVAIGDLRKYVPEIGYVVSTLDTLVDYVKVGIATGKPRDIEDIVREAAENALRAKVVVVGYADYSIHGTIEPLRLVDYATRFNVYGVMIDTLSKGSYTTPDLLQKSYLQKFVEKAKSSGLLVAVAGGIEKSHIGVLIELGFDVIGVRTAVCIGGRNGRVSSGLVKELKKALEGKANTL